jgi:hypothetical protein
MASDNVQLLSRVLPLGALVTYTSPSVIIQDYYNLSVVAKSDSAFTFELQFSGDGANWDFGISQAIAAGVGTNINHEVTQKWTRMLLTDTGGGGTYMRVYVYGTKDYFPGNVTLVIPPAAPPLPVTISNLSFTPFQELQVQEMSVESGWVTNSCTMGRLYDNGGGTKEFQSSYSKGVDVLCYCDDSLNGGVADNGFVGINGDGTIDIFFYDGIVSPPPPLGTTIPKALFGLTTRYVMLIPSVAYEFKTRFRIQYTPPLGPAPYIIPNVAIGLLSWQGIPSNGFVRSGYPSAPTFLLQAGTWFGYTGGVDASLLSVMNIYLWNAPFDLTSIPQNLWNIDTCDGTGALPLINDWDKTMHGFKITYAANQLYYLYWIQGNSGPFLPVHKHNMKNKKLYQDHFAPGIAMDNLSGGSYEKFLLHTDGWSLATTHDKTQIPRGFPSKDVLCYQNFGTFGPSSVVNYMHIVAFINHVIPGFAPPVPGNNVAGFQNSNFYIHSLTMCLNVDMNSFPQNGQIVQWGLFRNLPPPIVYAGVVQAKPLWPLQVAPLVQAFPGGPPPGPPPVAPNPAYQIAGGCLSYISGGDTHTLTGDDFGPSQNTMMGPNSYIDLILRIPVDAGPVLGSATLYYTAVICTY